MHYFLLMTGHYEIFFSAKFAGDLGVIKTKNCPIFKETVSTVPSGFDRTARVFSVQ